MVNQKIEKTLTHGAHFCIHHFSGPWKSIISRSFWAQVTENALSLATTPLTMATPAAADDPRADSGPALFQGSEHVLDVEHLPTAEDLWHCGRT